MTGVSTGALQAPFVFIHSKAGYQVLEQAYTTSGVADLIEKRSVLALPFSSSVATAGGLQALLRTHVTPEVLRSVAVESRAGRKLIVGTVNLDTGVLVRWDLGRLAECGALELFRDVLLASASAPPIFPPVCIDGGIHMDGGVRQQIFFPPILEALAEGAAARPPRPGPLPAGPSSGCPPPDDGAPCAYFVVNGYLGPHIHLTQPHVLDIGLRSVELLADEAIIGNLWKCWGLMKHVCGPTRPFHFRAVSMPRSAVIKDKSSMEYSRADMRKLYDAGYAMGRQSQGWTCTPCDLPEWSMTRDECPATAPTFVR